MNQRRSYSGPPRERGRSADRGDNDRRLPGRLPPSYSSNELTRVFGDGMLPPPPAIPNAGLVFDRFLRIWSGDFALVKERLGPLKLFIDGYEKLGKVLEQQLAAVHRQLESIVPEEDVGKRIAVTDARLVSGLGASHPLENGFCFDTNVGVPHLPGSSVKGLCRQMAEFTGDKQLVSELFGSGDENDDDVKSEASVGDVVFLPAYPEHWPRLDVDVINCHQSSYYGSEPVVLRSGPEANKPAPQSRDRKTPAGPLEVEDPVPVFFLTVAKDTPFVFRCFSRSRNRSRMDDALKLLGEGLENLGIGAKTALGYGVMHIGN